LISSAGAAAAAPIAASAATSGSALAGALADASVGTSLASGGVGALGAIRSAQAQGDAYKYQAQVDLNNQQLAGYYANQTAAAGQAKLSEEQQKQAQQMSLIRASQAASGVDVASGSSEDVRRSQEILNNLDALTIMSNTAQQVYGYQVSGTSEANQAGLEQLGASQTGAESVLGASSSLLSGASGAANQYLAWRRVGDTTSATGLLGTG
jgi:hypothetical protein